MAKDGQHDGWIYVGIRIVQSDIIDRIIRHLEKRGIFKSRQDIVAEALADYFERADIKRILEAT